MTSSARTGPEQSTPQSDQTFHLALVLGPKEAGIRTPQEQEREGMRLTGLMRAAQSCGVSQLTLLFEGDSFSLDDFKYYLELIDTSSLFSTLKVVDKLGGSFTNVIDPGHENDAAGKQDFAVTVLEPHDGQLDFLAALKALAGDDDSETPENLTDEALGAALHARTRFADLPDPDLIVYFGKRQTLSNLGVWVGAYAEFAFCEEPWQSFTSDGLERLLADFGLRERRFGAIREP